MKMYSDRDTFKFEQEKLQMYNNIFYPASYWYKLTMYLNVLETGSPQKGRPSSEKHANCFLTMWELQQKHPKNNGQFTY